MDYNWNDDWREELMDKNPRLMDRLAECQSTQKDIYQISKYMYKYNPEKEKIECLDRTILWITDWNSQVGLVPDKEEYNKILAYM